MSIITPWNVNDTKRYAKLFQQHVITFNSHYTVVITTNQILIGHETAGLTTNRGVFAYKAGCAKQLYLLLRMYSCNMDDMLRFIDTYGFTPLPDDEYLITKTPDPDEALKGNVFKLNDGKWV